VISYPLSPSAIDAQVYVAGGAVPGGEETRTLEIVELHSTPGSGA
jgi:hypothetical protein